MKKQKPFALKLCILACRCLDWAQLEPSEVPQCFMQTDGVVAWDSSESWKTWGDDSGQGLNDSQRSVLTLNFTIVAFLKNSVCMEIMATTYILYKYGRELGARLLSAGMNVGGTSVVMWDLGQGFSERKCFVPFQMAPMASNTHQMHCDPQSVPFPTLSEMLPCACASRVESRCFPAWLGSEKHGPWKSRAVVGRVEFSPPGCTWGHY